MKSFLWSFSPLSYFNKGSWQLLVKVCAQVLVDHKGLNLPRKSVGRLIDWLDIALTTLTGL